MTYVFTEGPIDQPWETTEDIDAFWYVHRAGFWKRNRAMPPESTVVEDNFYVEGSKWATELARRLNDLDTARARIALLEARLDALCGAANAKIVFDDHDVLDACMCEMCTLGRALTAAREVLGG